MYVSSADLAESGFRESSSVPFLSDGVYCMWENPASVLVRLAVPADSDEAGNALFSTHFPMLSRAVEKGSGPRETS